MTEEASRPVELSDHVTDEMVRAGIDTFRTRFGGCDELIDVVGADRLAALTTGG